jgi:hypothetical protein
MAQGLDSLAAPALRFPFSEQEFLHGLGHKPTSLSRSFRIIVGGYSSRSRSVRRLQLESGFLDLTR